MTEPAGKPERLCRTCEAYRVSPDGDEGCSDRRTNFQFAWYLDEDPVTCPYWRVPTPEAGKPERCVHMHADGICEKPDNLTYGLTCRENNRPYCPDYTPEAVEPERREWWCAHCRVWVPPERVTYEEVHEDCGFPVYPTPDPTPWPGFPGLTPCRFYSHSGHFNLCFIADEASLCVDPHNCTDYEPTPEAGEPEEKTLGWLRTGSTPELRASAASPEPGGEGLDVLRMMGGEVWRAIRGAIKSTIDAHGPITEEYIESAVKRIAGQLAAFNPYDVFKENATLTERVRELEGALEQITLKDAHSISESMDMKAIARAALPPKEGEER